MKYSLVFSPSLWIQPADRIFPSTPWAPFLSFLRTEEIQFIINKTKFLHAQRNPLVSCQTYSSQFAWHRYSQCKSNRLGHFPEVASSILFSEYICRCTRLSVFRPDLWHSLLRKRFVRLKKFSKKLCENFLKNHILTNVPVTAWKLLVTICTARLKIRLVSIGIFASSVRSVGSVVSRIREAKIKRRTFSNPRWNESVRVRVLRPRFGAARGDVVTIAVFCDVRRQS